MKFQFVALLAALAAAGPAAPPPLPVAVTFIDPSGPDGAPSAARLREVLTRQGWFEDVPSRLDPAGLVACRVRSSIEACIRTQTHESLGQGAPEVVVWMVGEDGKTRLTCYGPGEAFRSAERQTALVDLAAGGADGQAAAGCIIAAAAESGW